MAERGTTRHMESDVRSETVRVRVTPEERKWLEQVAREEERSVSSVLRMALRQFVEARDADRS